MRKEEETIFITQKTKGKLPRLPFLEIKNEILGNKYNLSIAFVGDKTSQKLNNLYRNKNKPTNILSFSLSKNSGEIIINPNKAKKEAPDFNMSFKNFLGFLTIHGMLHLKGMDHSSTMELHEKKFCSLFHFNQK